MTKIAGEEKLEWLFYRKILLYNDLLGCLKKERDHLVNLDLNLLWDISEEKEKLCRQIKAVRIELAAALKLTGGDRLSDFEQMLSRISAGRKENFQNRLQALSRLKYEVEALRRENVNLVDDSLRFIDEMITVITGETRNPEVYNGRRRMTKTGGNMLFCREV